MLNYFQLDNLDNVVGPPLKLNYDPNLNEDPLLKGILGGTFGQTDIRT